MKDKREKFIKTIMEFSEDTRFRYGSIDTLKMVTDGYVAMMYEVSSDDIERDLILEDLANVKKWENKDYLVKGITGLCRGKFNSDNILGEVTFSEFKKLFKPFEMAGMIEKNTKVFSYNDKMLFFPNKVVSRLFKLLDCKPKDKLAILVDKELCTMKINFMSDERPFDTAVCIGFIISQENRDKMMKDHQEYLERKEQERLEDEEYNKVS